MSVFRDTISLVTGGASGIGRAIGTALAAQGARVVLVDINCDGLEAADSAVEVVVELVRPDVVVVVVAAALGIGAFGFGSALKIALSSCSSLVCCGGGALAS